MQKNIFIFFSALSLSAGLLILFHEPFLQSILSLIGSLLHRELDISFWKIGFKKTGVELLLLAVNILLAILFYKKNPKRFLLFSSVLWIGIFIIYVFRNIVNIPIQDDYTLFLRFLNQYSSSLDLSTVFYQIPESRSILMQLLAVLLFHLHAFNFEILLFFSTVCLLGISLLFYRSIRAEQKPLLFLIIVILLFQFQYYDSIVYASGALYHTCTIFFVFCFLYLLAQHSSRAFILSIFCIPLSVLSNGSGFIGIICGIFFLFRQKRIKHLFIWIILSILVAVLYFNHYRFGNEYVFSSFTFFVYKIFKCLLFSCIFLGNSFQFLYQHTLPVIIGGIVWLFFLFLTIKRYYQKNPVIYFMLLYLIITACLVSFFRMRYGLLYAIPVRYSVYAITAVCCCIIAFFEITNFKGKMIPAMFFFLILSFLYHFSTNLFFYPEVVIRKERLVTFIQHFKKGEPFPITIDIPFTEEEEVKATIDESVSKNIYKIPDE